MQLQRPNLEPFALERFLGQHEFSAKFLLCASDCESLSVDELLALEPSAADDFKKTWLGYTEAAGSPALRETIAAQYQGLTPEDVLVFSGAQEAIFAFMQDALAFGDHAVVHVLYSMPRYNKCWSQAVAGVASALQSIATTIIYANKYGANLVEAAKWLVTGAIVAADFAALFIAFCGPAELAALLAGAAVSIALVYDYMACAEGW